MASSIEYDPPHGTALSWGSSTRTLPAIAETSTAKMAALLLGCFLSGYFLVYNDALHLGGLALALIYFFPRVAWRSLGPTLGSDRLLRWTAHFLCWMTLRSFFSEIPGSESVRREMSGWLFGALMLAGFGILVWIAASRSGNMQAPTLVAGFSAAFAAALSMILFYGILPGHILGERLQNWFVYGGLNAVSTGLTFGFAGLWLGLLWEKLPVRLKTAALCAIVILDTAVLFSRSRGALTALAVGHIALVICRGWRRAWVIVAVFLGVTILYQAAAPLVTWGAEQEAAWKQKRGGQSVSIAVPVAALENPARELVDRKDSGRFDIYRAALGTLHDVPSHLVGIGEWGTDHLWNSYMPFKPEHMHSALLATYVHGGGIGLALLIAVLTLGFQRAASLTVRTGDDQWLILLLFGMAGVIFDGQTFASLTSVPQFESLLVWFPIFASASAWSKMKQAAG